MLRVSVLSALIAGGLLSAGPQPQPIRPHLVFEQNHGQAPTQVKWMGQGSSYKVLLSSEGATVVFANPTDVRLISMRLPGRIQGSLQLKYSAIRMKLVGSHPWNDISGAEPTGGVSNYVNASDGKRSLTNIPHYARIKIAAVYQGIDLIFYSDGDDLRYDFVVAKAPIPSKST